MPGLDIEQILERVGDGAVLAAAGLLVGLAFGSLAQQSRFCLRAGTIEFSRGELGPKIAVWVLAFSAAVAATQGAIALGVLSVAEARQLAARGSISGALVGGALFGCGMILARGCASRLLVLSATGNLRALITGLILTIVAQASFRGVLAPAREKISLLWTVEGGAGRNVLVAIGAGPWLGFGLGCAWLAVGIWLARRNRLAGKSMLAAIGVGVTIAAGWIVTYAISKVSFEGTRITSISFTGPSTDTLMGLINERTLPLSFDIGLVPGVFIGSLVAALLTREFQLQGFEGGRSMLRYIAGAVLMGFGSMLAGGCAVGAGVTGSSIFAITGWLALAAMWAGAVATERLFEGVPHPALPQASPR
jgi:uncharacterized membrane protein YedE/YeeE